MDAEIDAYRRQIQSILGRVLATLEGLEGAKLNRKPPVDGANSAYVIAAHTLGNARAWVLGIACGRPIERDRPAEFRASGGDAAALVEGARRLSAEVDAALEALPASHLDRRSVPDKSLWGEGEPMEVSAREALLHVIEHASIHLGQLQVTRDWVLGAGGGEPAP